MGETQGPNRRGDDQEERVRLGRTITVLRSALGMKQGELAAKAGVSKSMLSACETGSSSPEAMSLTKIFQGLGLPLSALDDALDFLEWIESLQDSSGAWRQAFLLRQRAGAALVTSQPRPGEGRPHRASHLRAAAAIGNAVAQNLLRILKETEGSGSAEERSTPGVRNDPRN